jgi:hypothetical protein
MGAWMRNSRRPRARVLEVEPLEGRRLPSGFRPPSAPDVVEVDLAVEADRREVSVARSRLPAGVVGTPNAAVLAWTATDADWSRDAGVPANAIRETKHNLGPADLPAATWVWVRGAFPGAVADEAVGVIKPDGVRQGVSLITPRGQEGEAGPRLGSGDRAASGTSPEVAPPVAGPDAIADTTISARVAGATMEVRTWERSEARPTAAATLPAGTTYLVARGEVPDLVVGPDTTVPLDTPRAGDEPAVPPVATALRDLLAMIPTAGLSPVAGAIREGLPIDLAAVEHQLGQFVDGLDDLTDALAEDAGGRDLAAWLLLGAVVVAGTPRVVRRKRVSGSAARPSWSWVLGAPPGPEPR